MRIGAPCTNLCFHGEKKSAPARINHDINFEFIPAANRHATTVPINRGQLWRRAGIFADFVIISCLNGFKAWLFFGWLTTLVFRLYAGIVNVASACFRGLQILPCVRWNAEITVWTIQQNLTTTYVHYNFLRHNLTKFLKIEAVQNKCRGNWCSQ